MKLGSGNTIECQVWVANVEMAISVAKVVHGNFCTQETLRVLHTPQLKPFQISRTGKPQIAPPQNKQGLQH